MSESHTTPRKLGELLIKTGAIQPDQLEAALEKQKLWGRPLGITLVRMGSIDEQTLVRTLATQLKLPVVQLQGKRVNPEVLELVPVDLSEKYRCLPLLVDGVGESKVLFLGMEDPADREAVAEISHQIGMRVEVVLVAPSELDECIHRHYHWASMDFGVGARLGEPGSSADRELSRPGPGSSQGHGSRLEGMGLADSGSVADEELSFLEMPGESDPILFAASEEFAPEAPQAPAPPSTGDDAMLRAIAQLLIEKGIFSRDELVKRLQAVMSAGDA